MAALPVGEAGENLGQEFHELRTILNDHVSQCMTTSVAFDPQEELLWVGTASGHITSYFGPENHKYTAFHGHDTDVKQIVPDAYGVLSLTSNQVRYSTRQGLKIFNAIEPTMQDMQCMVHYDSNYVTLAGHQDHFYELDITTGEVYPSEVEVNPGLVVMKHSDRFLCCGDSQGKVTLRDPETMESLHILDAHGATLSDFDVHDNTLVTCGFSTRFGHLNVDRFLMVYDLRTLRAFPPLQVPIDPFIVKFMPTYTTRCVVASQVGQFLLCQPESLMYDPLIYQTSAHGAVLDFDISTSYQAMAFGDSAGYVHVWADRGEDELIVNPYSQPTVFADEVQQDAPLAFDDYSIPLSSIAMPECKESLLSDWPEHLTNVADRRAPEIDPEILKNMTVRQFVGYAPNPKRRLRNQVAYKLENSNGNSDSCPPESPLNRDPSSSLIPKMYRKVDIKYSKYGVEKFDFKHYNRTHFAGLEIHIPNAYCNSMLQVLYLLEPVRISMQNHVCQKEFCLACELGFLFRMLDITDGQTCQATNFLRAFRTIREASAMGLILSDADASSCSLNLAKIIQNWYRFVLQQIHQDTQIKTEDAEDQSADIEERSIVKDIFGSRLETQSKCKCGLEQSRESDVFIFELQYFENGGKLVEDEVDRSFVSLLSRSITRQQVVPAWCEECKKYQSTVQERRLKSLPGVLNINCRLDQPREFEFWRKHLVAHVPSYHGKPLHKLNTSPPKPCRYGKLCNRPGCRFSHGRDGDIVQSSPAPADNEGHYKSFFPLAFTMRIDPETTALTVKEYSEKDDESPVDEQTEVYRLASIVSNIQDPHDGHTTVASVHVAEQYHAMKGNVEKHGWYIFNDFAITPVSEFEVLDFSAEWKVPCCLIYTKEKLIKNFDPTIEQKIDSSILISEASLVQRQVRFSRQFTPLNSSEIPLEEGSFVGIDAEFVTLNQEESEMRSDGTLSTVKPSQMCAARITVVRGWGTLMGVPFIDDYISTSEQVVDYLTRFSGIKPGDLDVSMSSKHLTTLKTTYQKLLHLIDCKIVFIGHGLKKDFRVINIVVPREQVIDTAELFRVPNQRYISLKFLAWHFLNIKIQSETHDSTEDAYAAMKLFFKYQEILNTSGEEQFERELEVLYDTGRQLNWQIPD
eukprot:gene5348-6019_t